MAITFQQFREKNPQYGDISDGALFNQLHEAYYPSMPKAELAKAIQFEIPDQPFSEDLQEFGRQALGGVAVDLNRTVGQAARAFTDEGSLVSDWAEDVVKRADARAPEYAYDESGKGLLAQAMQRGVRALPVSALAMGATAVNPVLGAAVTGGLFGGSAYQDTEDSVLAADGTPEQAKEAGLQTGALNAGGELIGNYLGLRALGFGRKALEGTVNKALGKVTNDAILKPFGKALGIDLVGEAITEEAQTLGTEYIERQYNAGSGEEYGKLAKDALLTTAGLTALLGGGGIVGHTRNAMVAQKYDKVLADPAIDKDERSAVVQDLYQQFKASGIQDADNWLIGAKNDIDAGKPIRRDGTLDIPDVTQADSVDEAIVAADAALNWETPTAKINPNTPLQQQINDQFKGSNYVPGEEGQVWEQPQANAYQAIINKPVPVTDADIDAVTPEDMAKILPKPTSLRERGLLERARNNGADESATGSNAERVADIAGADGAITTPTETSEVANDLRTTELPNTAKDDDLQDEQQQTPGHNFQPTHVLNDGYDTPVQKIADNLYLDSEGFEIEDYSATPIKETDNALPAAGKEGQVDTGLIDRQQGIEAGERRTEADDGNGNGSPLGGTIDNGALNKLPSGEKWIKSQDGYKAELEAIQSDFEQDKDLDKLKKAKHKLRKKWSEKYTEAKKVSNEVIAEEQPDLPQKQNNNLKETASIQPDAQVSDEKKSNAILASENQLTKQKRKINNLRSDATTKGSLDDKLSAEKLIKEAENQLRKMRLNIFDMEDAINNDDFNKIEELKNLFPDAYKILTNNKTVKDEKATKEIPQDKDKPATEAAVFVDSPKTTADNKANEPVLQQADKERISEDNDVNALENIPDSFLDTKEYDVDVLENGVVEPRAMTARARLENNQEQIDAYQAFINCMGG